MTRKSPLIAVLLLLLAPLVVAAPAVTAGTAAAAQEPFDIVLAGGTVMDPETELSAVRHVGIRGNRIEAISEEALEGTQVIDVAGLIVAPGFVDMHAHGQSYEANVFQAHDGVTTALELEGGVGDVASFLEGREGDALVNYGASVSHGQLRIGVMPKYAEALAAVSGNLGEEGELDDFFALLGEAGYDAVDPASYGALKKLLHANLRAGGLGLGVPHQYYPGATHDEIFRVFQMAGEWYVPIYTHVRDMAVSAFQEVIANAAATGAPLHIVHINSMSLGHIGTTLDLIGGAQARGIDVSAEAYPYTAASTGLNSAIFDEGWQEKLGISYGDVQWEATGERLTEATFNEYRAAGGGTVIIHMMKPEWVEMWMKTPFVMIASDGMPYAPGAHPRSAGTFTRVLGRYAREQEMLPLMEAISRMSFMPAKRLERFAPSMARKGRLQVGMDADITVFDAGRVIDTATFEDDLSKSEGVEYVLVNGVMVVHEGATVEGVFPGRPVLGRLYDGS